MKAFFIRVGLFLRLIDDQHNLSLTNIATIIVVIKLALAQQASAIDLGTLLLALANYNVKKYLTSAPQGNLAQMVQEVKTVITEHNS